MGCARRLSVTELGVALVDELTTRSSVSVVFFLGFYGCSSFLQSFRVSCFDWQRGLVAGLLERLSPFFGSGPGLAAFLAFPELVNRSVARWRSDAGPGSTDPGRQ
jgi:hypothetical protein